MGDCLVVFGIVAGSAFMFWAGYREGGRQERKFRWMREDAEACAKKLYGPRETP